ncbi:hypothetical protein [Nocardia sp. NPDC004415]
MREYAVPAAMIETATARRRVGDWAGACAAAGVDVDLDLRALTRSRGRETAARVRADLRHLAPDLLRWHLPRVAPDGLLRPGLTIPLARYDPGGGAGDRVSLVVRTAPAWADAGQRLVLALSDGTGGSGHPHPRPHRRFRLDLHRHLWDARRAHELRMRAGAPHDATEPESWALGGRDDSRLPVQVPDTCAVHRWAAEAALMLRADGASGGLVQVRYGARRQVVLDLTGPCVRIAPGSPRGVRLPVLPDAATWVLPDLALLHAGAITADRLHPLVAAALVPGSTSVGSRPHATSGHQVVLCRGERHRIGMVDGVLTALDHDPAELRREELLVALTGTPLPCLRVIDQAHRRPDGLTGVRERLDHGDIAGALAVVEGLLGPAAALREGPLLDALRQSADRRTTYGLFRAGLSAPGQTFPLPPRSARRVRGGHPRHAVRS